MYLSERTRPKVSEKNAGMEEMPAVETRAEGCGSTSIHVTADSLSGAAGSLCPCLGTVLRAELIFFALYTTKIVLEERFLLQHLFGD